LRLPEHVMEEEIVGAKHITLINSTFNANPDAVYSALTYIAQKKGEKILVIQPLIELGAYADAVHRTIGKQAAAVCSYIVVTNRNFLKAIKEGVLETGEPVSKITIGKLPQIEKHGIWLFVGKEASSYCQIVNARALRQ